MNSPFFFSWEFTFGTYLPLLSPFVITLGQVAFKILRRRRNKRLEEEKEQKELKEKHD